jgi:hypothetical protein
MKIGFELGEDETEVTVFMIADALKKQLKADKYTKLSKILEADVGSDSK